MNTCMKRQTCECKYLLNIQFNWIAQILPFCCIEKFSTVGRRKKFANIIITRVARERGEWVEYPA